MLDKLLKEIVTETQQFDLEKFIPLMKQYVNDKSPHIRRLLISWIDIMDNIPGIDILDFLPEFLDGLFDMLSDPHREIRQVRQNEAAQWVGGRCFAADVAFGNSKHGCW